MEDKPQEFIQNWNPISVINVELLSGVLAHRLQQVFLKIIGNEQNGFLSFTILGFKKSFQLYLNRII